RGTLGLSALRWGGQAAGHGPITCEGELAASSALGALEYHSAHGGGICWIPDSIQHDLDYRALTALVVARLIVGRCGEAVDCASTSICISCKHEGRCNPERCCHKRNSVVESAGLFTQVARDRGGQRFGEEWQVIR